ncbi:MAG: hypothetical protein P4L50_24955 [Anaerolineaceae bacterium]|nr:hypothetical protein [Anaerolineaceae bacterium]
MNLDSIIRELDLKPLTETQDFTQVVPSGGYASDLLSCVMAGAPHQGIWITLQAHANIVAVAALLELSAVIITEGAIPDPATIEKANREHVILLSTTAPTYSVIGKLWTAGLVAN